MDTTIMEYHGPVVTECGKGEPPKAAWRRGAYNRVHLLPKTVPKASGQGLRLTEGPDGDDPGCEDGQPPQPNLRRDPQARDVRPAIVVVIPQTVVRRGSSSSGRPRIVESESEYLVQRA